MQLAEQLDTQTVRRRLREGEYSRNIGVLESDLRLLYSNGLHCFPEKSVGWLEAAKLYQTALVNVQRGRKKLSALSVDGGPGKGSGAPTKYPIGGIASVATAMQQQHKSVASGDRCARLNLLNPYNTGRIGDSGEQRVASIGEQVGRLKTGTPSLLGYKEDRRNKVTVLSYLDYGANFSFGPSYDSGNAYSSKETSDLLIQAYGDGAAAGCQDDAAQSAAAAAADNELSEIIPEFTLGDDFSLYLMNTFTRDIVRAAAVAAQSDGLAGEGLDEGLAGEGLGQGRDAEEQLEDVLASGG